MLYFKKDVNPVKIAEVLNVDDMTWVEKQYYFNEEWNVPFTKEQLIRRGECCALGCRNCPYTKPRKKGNQELED